MAQSHTFAIFLLVCSLFANTQPATAVDLFVHTKEGADYLFEISPEETLQEVQNLVEDLFAQNIPEQNWFIDELVSLKESTTPTIQVAKASANTPSWIEKDKGPRDYSRPLKENEKKDISYILTTLANESPTSLWSKEESLNEAGHRIDHVHPLRFWVYSFSDKETKDALFNLFERRWVWNRFTKGMQESLNYEDSKKNITPDMIKDAAKTLKIDVKVIKTPLEKKKWKDFMEALVYNVPKEEGYDRYGI